MTAGMQARSVADWTVDSNRAGTRSPAKAAAPFEPKLLPIGNPWDERRAGTSEPDGAGKASRGADVRARILAAALECFSATGFEGTTTCRIAERTKITHSLVNYHFRSKEILWIATIQFALGQYEHAIKENLHGAAGRSAKEILQKFIHQFVRMSAQQPQIHRILTSEGGQATPRLEWIVRNFIDWHFTTLRDVIRRGQSEGTVRQCDPARLYYLIIGAGSTPFTLSTEYRATTGRDVFAEPEILRNIAFIHEIVFT